MTDAKVTDHVMLERAQTAEARVKVLEGHRDLWRRTAYRMLTALEEVHGLASDGPIKTRAAEAIDSFCASKKENVTDG